MDFKYSPFSLLRDNQPTHHYAVLLCQLNLALISVVRKTGERMGPQHSESKARQEGVRKAGQGCRGC